MNHAGPVVWQFYLFRRLGGFVFAPKVKVDGDCGVTSITDGRDEVARAVGIITAGEKAWIAGHPGFAIDEGNAGAPAHFQFQLVSIQPGWIAILPESGDDSIRFDYKFAARDGDRAATTTGIRITELVADEFNAAHVHTVVAQHRHRRKEIPGINMLHHRPTD